MLVVFDQVVDLELQHALALSKVHLSEQTSRLVDSIAVGAALWTELESCTSLTNLLVEFRANFPVDGIQVLVSQSNISHGAIRIEESIINDAIVFVDGRATQGANTMWL